MEIPSSKVHMDCSVATPHAQRRQNLVPPPASSAYLTTNIAEKNTFSQAARDLLAKDGDTSNTLDFSNIRPDEILGTVNSLIKSGKMSLDESTSLMGLVPLSLRKPLGQVVSYMNDMGEGAGYKFMSAKKTR